jgi:uncharacterized protein
MMLVVGALGMWWHVLAMFLLGAALLKLGLFEPHRRRWHVRFVLVGICVALPLCAAAELAPRWIDPDIAAFFDAPLMLLVGPMLSLAYLGGITLLVSAGRLRPVTTALAATGRMALTNYLTQTLVATSIFYYWGLGWFGQISDAQRVGVALAIYLPQVALSVTWLRFFRFGPMEWLWRSITYLRPQAMLAGRKISA